MGVTAGEAATDGDGTAGSRGRRRGLAWATAVDGVGWPDAWQAATAMTSGTRARFMWHAYLPGR